MKTSFAKKIAENETVMNIVSRPLNMEYELVTFEWWRKALISRTQDTAQD